MICWLFFDDQVIYFFKGTYSDIIKWALKQFEEKLDIDDVLILSFKDYQDARSVKRNFVTMKSRGYMPDNIGCALLGEDVFFYVYGGLTPPLDRNPRRVIVYVHKF